MLELKKKNGKAHSKMAANVKNEAPELNVKICRPQASTMEEWTSIAKVLEKCIAKEEYLHSSKQNNATMAATSRNPDVIYSYWCRSVCAIIVNMP